MAKGALHYSSLVHFLLGVAEKVYVGSSLERREGHVQKLNSSEREITSNISLKIQRKNT